VHLEVENTLTSTGSVRVTITSDAGEAQYDLKIDEDGMRAIAVTPDVVFVTTRSETLGAELLTRTGVIILLGGDGVVSPPGVLFRPNRTIAPLSRAQLTAVDWGSIERNRESRGPSRDEATVQGWCLQLLLTEPWDLVIDDDGKGEVADLVALRTVDGVLEIKLVHCKFAHGGTVGSRLVDLYELCGQANKSAVWRRHPDKMLRRLLDRERRRIRLDKPSGIEVGEARQLLKLIADAPVLRTSMEIVLAQPGLSRSRASNPQLELLASTQVYLRETAAARMSVLCSD
jgi:hypothetical protein